MISETHIRQGTVEFSAAEVHEILATEAAKRLAIHCEGFPTCLSTLGMSSSVTFTGAVDGAVCQIHTPSARVMVQQNMLTNIDEGEPA